MGMHYINELNVYILPVVLEPFSFLVEFVTHFTVSCIIHPLYHSLNIHVTQWIAYPPLARLYFDPS